MFHLPLAGCLAVGTLTPPQAEEVTFEVKAGTAVKTFEFVGTRTTVESELVLGEMGEHRPGEGMVSETVRTYAVTDACRESDGRRPTRLVRAYDELITETEMDAPEGQPGMHMEIDHGGASELEGYAVQFDWDPEAGEYRKSFPEGEDPGEEEWLAGLKADMDYLSFLPGEPVSVGDTWTLGAGVVGDLLSPGGELMVQAPPDDLPEGGLRISLGDATAVGEWDGLEGGVEVRLAEVRGEADARIAVLEFEVEVEGARDVGEALSRRALRDEGMQVVYDTADLERAVAGGGTLLWNLTAGRLEGLEFEAEMQAQVDLAWTADAGAMELDLTLHQVLSGTYAVTVEVE